MFKDSMTDHLPERKPSLRLGGWNYTDPIWYYVTICTHEKHLLFGAINNEFMHLNKIGSLIQQHWLNLPIIRSHVVLDEFIVMPNHLHGLIYLKTSEEPPSVGLQRCRNRSCDHSSGDRSLNHPHDATKTRGTVRPRSLSAIIRNFKSYAAREINSQFSEPGESIWQRDFHDEVVRSEARLNQIRRYIRENPRNWKHDPEYWE